MGTEDGSEAMEKKKSHRDRKSGRKAEKKKQKNPHIQELTDRQRNPKAFAINSAVRAERRFRRKQDIETKKQHVPLVDRTPIEPPPILVAVVGPPKVGKTTLINNLIKSFTRSPLTNIQGPVTIVTGKKRRLTFIECNNDINSMIDIAKVADLVLLLCDASFGFEMEIFEFLNICQVHGMPRIMGVLTHLDMLRNAKTLKRVKKTLKHRFWTEVYAGAKLFYLSGITHGEYLRNEIKNLGRFISVMKFRPLTWRSTHSYLLVDRYEDLTSPENIRQDKKCDRKISLYGYVRGVPLNKNCSVHIAGVGDHKIYDVSFLPDPCPLPDAIKKRSLVDKERLIYAPFSGVGGIVYDKDAVYVDLGGSHSHSNENNKTDAQETTRNLVENLIETKQTLDLKISESEIQMFSGSKMIKSKDVGKSNLSSIEEEDSDSSSENGGKTVKENSAANLNEKKDVSENCMKKESLDEDDVEKELKALKEKDFTKFKEELITDSTGRVRRKVLFTENMSESDSENDDDEANGTVSSKESNEEDNSDDSDVETFAENNKHDISNKLTENKLGLNKSGDIHSKVSEVLKMLDSKDNADSDEASDDSMSEVDDESTFNDKITDEDDSESDASEDEDSSKQTVEKSNRKSAKDIFLTESKTNEDSTMSGSENSDRESLVDEDDEIKWKSHLAKKAQDAFLDRQVNTKNLMKLIYGVFDGKQNLSDKTETKPESDDENEIGGLFKVVTSEQQKIQQEKESMNLPEISLFTKWSEEPRDWLVPENKILIENCFVTGKWKESEDADELLKLDAMSDGDSDIDGDFEDLETGEKHVANKKRKFDDIDNGEESNPKAGKMTKEALIEKKKRLKEKFDSEYDNGDEKNTYYDELKSSVEKQTQLNKSVFEEMADDVRVQLEGYRPGMYIRLEIENMPYEFVEHFDATYPIIVGALNMGEENIGFVNVRVKKHRWFKRTLKTNDPVIISLGWRRFETLPLYSKFEDNHIYRYLKYTPEHVTCNAHFWGPITPQGTGFLAIQNCTEDEKVPETLEHLLCKCEAVMKRRLRHLNNAFPTPDQAVKQGFRITATGTVLELDRSTQVMKKLKLIGAPCRKSEIRDHKMKAIYKKTAFITGMFKTALEVAKFEGAKIKTVSGIRGIIKKVAGRDYPEGCFRATFEDTIVKSDIVFCRTWYRVNVEEHYNPVTNLLMEPGLKNKWFGMKTVGQLKRERGLRSDPNQDSLYTEIKRDPKVFKPLVIPKSLQKRLPYADKPKLPPSKLQNNPNAYKSVAVIREPEEEKVAALMKRIKTAYAYKQDKLKEATTERMKKRIAELKAAEKHIKKKQKESKKEVCKMKSRHAISQEKKAGC